MKRLLIFLCILLLLSSSTLCSAAANPALPQIVIVENDWPPYYFGKPTQATGFAKDILSLCVPKSGFIPKFQFFPVKRMYFYLEQGEIDVALFSYKKKRESLVRFGTVPLFKSSYQPVVRRESKITIEKLEDFDDLRLGHLAGLRYSPHYLDYINNRQTDGNLFTTTAGDSAMKMLLDNIIDVYVNTRDTVLWRAHKMDATDRIKILDYDIKTSEYFVTVSNYSKRIQAPQKFLKSIDQCILDLKQSRQFDEMAAKYGISY